MTLAEFQGEPALADAAQSHQAEHPRPLGFRPGLHLLQLVLASKEEAIRVVLDGGDLHGQPGSAGVFIPDDLAAHRPQRRLHRRRSGKALRALERAGPREELAETRRHVDKGLFLMFANIEVDGRSSGEQGVERRPHRVQVRCLRDLRGTLALLRSHEGRGAQHGIASRQVALPRGVACDTEVGELGHARVGEEDVRGLDVSVDDPRGMGSDESREDTIDDVQRLGLAGGLDAAQEISDRASIHQLHGDERHR